MMRVLNDVYIETIAMDDEVTTRAKSILTEFVENKFFPEMRELSKAIFQRIYYSGSFYDGLRVGEATEFDLNVVFDLPFYEDDFDLVKTTHADAKVFKVIPGSAVYCTKKTFEQLMPSTHPR